MHMTVRPVPGVVLTARPLADTPEGPDNDAMRLMKDA